MQETKLLTREEVAKILHIHINLVTIFKEEGLFEYIKCGKRFLYYKESVYQFINDYKGLDCSNRNAIRKNKKIVEDRKKSL